LIAQLLVHLSTKRDPRSWIEQEYRASR
jgi:hypothetical protein